MTTEDRSSRRETRRTTYKAISSGTTFICIGTVLLLNTLDILEWGVWLELVRLWPVFLIAVGIRFLFMETVLHPLCLVGPLLVVVATVWAADRYTARVDAGLEELDDVEVTAFECPLPPAGRPAHLELGFEGGRLSVEARDTTAAEMPTDEPVEHQEILRGDVRFLGDDPEPECEKDGGLHMGRRRESRDVHIIYPFWGSRQNQWESILTASRPVDLAADVSRADGEMDLRGMRLDRLDLDSRVSTLTVSLGEPVDVVPVRMDGALSTVTLTVPESTCFTVVRERRLGILSVEDSYRRTRRGPMIAGSCPDGKAEGPRYEIRYNLPLSYVSVRTEENES